MLNGGREKLETSPLKLVVLRLVESIATTYPCTQYCAAPKNGKNHPHPDILVPPVSQELKDLIENEKNN